jgi:hypothetical protein
VVSFDAGTGRYVVSEPAAPLSEAPEAGAMRYPCEPLDADALLKRLAALGRQWPLLLQPRLRGHRTLEPLVGPGGLGTLRVVTVKPAEGPARAVGAHLKMAAETGGPEAFCAGGIAAALDAETGRIERAGTRYGDEEEAEHPVSGVPFKGFVVPLAREACAACLRAHEAMVAQDREHPLPMIGFDMALTEEGCRFMEANCPSDLQFQKLDPGPLWRNEDFVECIRSYLAPLRGRGRIELDPVLRGRGEG